MTNFSKSGFAAKGNTIFDETKMLELKSDKMTCNLIYDLIKSHVIQSHKENSKEKREKLTLVSRTDK